MKNILTKFTLEKLRFSAGVMILFYETIFVEVDRPWLLVIAAGLMGYAIPKKLDKLLNGGD